MKKLLMLSLIATFLFSCGEPAKVPPEDSTPTDNRQTEPQKPDLTCSAAQPDCPDGYKCDQAAGTCKKSCNNNNDCSSACEYCSGQSGLCEPFPKGEKIGDCNGEFEECNGSGKCICIGNHEGHECNSCLLGWSGHNCDSCAPHFTGENCSECESGYFGQNCTACACGSLQCNDGRQGSGSCYSCPEGYTGLACDKCLPGRFGNNCQPCNCQHGTCNDGINGSGHCNECEENYWDIDCDKEPTCVNGTASTGINGNGHCSECTGNYWGKNCDQTPSCVNGTPKLGIAGDGKCSSCITGKGWTGENCDICNGYGSDCTAYDGSISDQDGNNYKTIIINNQEWMAENYKRNIGTHYVPNNVGNNVATYGYLYDWGTATSSNFCPSGWRLPKERDFFDLLNYIKNKRKSKSNFLSLITKSSAWLDYSELGGDDFGFGALPAGYYDANNNNGYSGFGRYAGFWSSTTTSGVGGTNSNFASYLRLDGDTGVGGYFKTDGRSVRCMRDIEQQNIILTDEQ